jgi:hypothetical protein
LIFIFFLLNHSPTLSSFFLTLLLYYDVQKSNSLDKKNERKDNSLNRDLYYYKINIFYPKKTNKHLLYLSNHKIFPCLIQISPILLKNPLYLNKSTKKYFNTLLKPYRLNYSKNSTHCKNLHSINIKKKN